MKQSKGLFLACLFALLGLYSCDTIDCTLNNTVAMYSNFYQDGKLTSINDTLSITAANTSVVLLNRQLKTSSMALSLSYSYPEDTLLLNVSGDGYTITDTLWIEKTSTTHFESPDCPVNMFHKITGVRSTHMFIDSVTITRPDVDYLQDENIQIHFYPSVDVD